MTTFVLVPGAGGNASYWDELVPELTARGQRGVAVDIAQDDPALGLLDYAARVVQAIDAAVPAGDGYVLVAQSLGGFLAPLVAERRPPRRIALLNAMIPLPGETIADWWDVTGSGAARRASDEAAGRDPEFDVERHFLHDLPAGVKARLLADPTVREVSDTPWRQPAPFERWPDVPITVLAGRDDRFFPLEFQRKVARERLALDVIEIAGGHLVALSNPGDLADRLVAT